MTYELLKWLHLTAIILLILSLGGAAFHVMNGGTKEFNLIDISTVEVKSSGGSDLPPLTGGVISSSVC